MKLLLLLGLSAAIYAQQVIGTATQEVLLDLVVRDSKGRLIQDLRAAELNVFDNGAAQSIRSFRLVRGAGAAAADARKKGTDAQQTIARATSALSTAASTGEPRLVTIAFDQLRPEQRSMARQTALEALKMEGGSSLYWAVFSIDHKLTLLSSYTSDRDRTELAISRACNSSFSLNTDESERIQRQQDVAALAERLETVKASADPGQTASTEQRIAQMTLNMLQFADTSERTQQGRSQLMSLWALVREQKRLPGRKTLIYLTGGMSLPPDYADNFRTLIADANAANVSVYSIDVSGLTTNDGNSSGVAILRQAASSSRSNMIDRTGVTSPDQAQSFDRAALAASSNLQNSLDVLSRDTGGFMAANSNDFRPAMRRINEETTSHYELTYSPRIEHYDGHERKILVKVSRPGATLRTRSGYFALPPMPGFELESYEGPMLSALSAPEAPKAFPFRAEAQWFPSASGDPRTAVVVDVPIEHITLTRDEPRNAFHMHLSVLHLFKDSSGAIVHKLTRDVPGQGELKNFDATRAGHFIHTDHVLLPPGEYTLETAVYDRENLKISGARQRIVVLSQPPRLAMSSLIVVRKVTPTTRVDDAANPFEFPGGKITPELNHSVRPGGGFEVYMVVQGQTDPGARLAIDLLRDGKIVSTGANRERPTRSEDGRLHYIASVPVGDALTPGGYEIRARLSQPGSDVEQRLNVTVE